LAATTPRKKRRPSMPAPTNFWDVAIALISKGLPIPILMAGIIIYAIFRMPQSDIRSFVLQSLSCFNPGWVQGTLFAILMAVIWIMREKLKLKQQEICRIAKERDKWQQVAGCTIESSDPEA